MRALRRENGTAWGLAYGQSLMMQLFAAVTANDVNSPAAQRALADLNSTPAITFYVLGPGQPLSKGNFWGGCAQLAAIRGK